jgi:hypothetical protein
MTPPHFHLVGVSCRTKRDAMKVGTELVVQITVEDVTLVRSTPIA